VGVAALVWKRVDFRESSRIVTLFTREHGKLTALARGAHRGDSAFLGRIDFLNEVRVTLSADRGGLRVLQRADLVHERRALRSPARYLAASHLAGLADAAAPQGRADAALFDLANGGLTLLERCPEAAIGTVLLGLELRFLSWLGALPDLQRCTDCGTELAPGSAFLQPAGGLCCRAHARSPRRPIPFASLQWLARVQSLPGRRWPAAATGAPPAASISLVGAWLEAAIERRSRLRPTAFRRARSAAAPPCTPR
jgi:DNA repair protein RecO (recombination protein O)